MVGGKPAAAVSSASSPPPTTSTTTTTMNRKKEVFGSTTTGLSRKRNRTMVLPYDEPLPQDDARDQSLSVTQQGYYSSSSIRRTCNKRALGGKSYQPPLLPLYLDHPSMTPQMNPHGATPPLDDILPPSAPNQGGRIWEFLTITRHPPPPVLPKWGMVLPSQQRIKIEPFKAQRYGHEHYLAATQIQRCWRGYQSRRRFWRCGGQGSYLMARRIQCMVRSFLARRRMAARVNRRMYLVVSRIQALYRGFKGRQTARIMRVDIANKAAQKLQRMFRGELNRRWFKAFKFAVHTAKATVIQKIWRGHCGKKRARQTRATTEAYDNQFKELIELDNQGILLHNLYAFQTDGPPPFLEPDRPEVKPSVELFIQVAALYICHRFKLDVAHKVIDDALFLFPESVLPLMYLKAIVCQLMWSEIGPLKMKRCDVLEEGLYYLRMARAMDGVERRGFMGLLDQYFYTCLRLWPTEPTTLLALAVALQSIYGFFNDELPLTRSVSSPRPPSLPATTSSPHPPPKNGEGVVVAGLSAKARARRPCDLMMTMGYTQCERLYNRCRQRCGFELMHIMTANERVFHDLFATKRTVLIERNKTFKPPGTNKTGYDLPGKAPSPATGGPSITTPGEDRPDIRAFVVVARVNFRIVVSSSLKVAGGSIERRYLPDIVVHEEEVNDMAIMATEAEIKSGVPEAMVRNKDKFLLVAEYIHRRVVAVTRAVRGPNTNPNALIQGDTIVVVPSLVRVRDFKNHHVVIVNAAITIQRCFRGLLGRMRVRRIRARLLAEALQSFSHEIKLGKFRAYRAHRYAACQMIQARVRRWIAQSIYQNLRAAATLVQKAYRRYRFRKVAQMELKRKLEGAEVVEAFRGGVVISGRPLMLVAKRCGLSFKFVGHDQQTCETYIGYVYEPVVLRALAAQGGHIKPWQKEKVVELLISMLALVDAIPALSMELDYYNKSSTLVLDVEKGAAIGTSGKRQASLQRVLRDELKAYRNYTRLLETKRRRLISHGKREEVQVLRQPWDINHRLPHQITRTAQTHSGQMAVVVKPPAA